MHGLWIVIPSFDNPSVTSRCLAALRPSDAMYTVCVVDHGELSTVEELEHDFPDIATIRATPDLWWTGATNAGIRRALAGGASHIMILNSDCVLDSAEVRRIWEVSQAMDSAILAPVQRDLHDDRPMVVRSWTGLPAGFPTLRSEHRVRGRGVIPTRMIIGGRGAVVPRQVFEHVGLFNEDALPHYLADHDFYLRCRRAGFPLLIHAGASVFVDPATSSVAASVGDLDFPHFASSLRHRKSHRNIEATRAFFQLNYPVRPLWWIGFALALSRYTAVWTVTRAIALAKAGFKRVFGRGVGPE